MNTPSMLGPYPVERELGRGGMGVVYLARDPRLDRPVAIKVLPEALALNPDNLARFEREAKLLAAVNHPNVASIFGVEEVNGQRLLVMEYVAGDTLSERITRGALPIAEALDVARQMAAGIEAAHEGGIIHRDLKPGNIKITPEGVVKVLDFGLAKGAAASSTDLAQSPTLTYSPTAIGVILGTAGYMSPEQARGKAVDRRADIWAFACVLFECLTGRKTFEGETVSDTIARIIEREPEWDALPADTPSRVRDLLRRCLDKDLKKRQRDIGDVRIEIEEALALRSSAIRASGGGAAPAVRPQKWARIALAAGLVALGAAAGIGVWTLAGPAARRTPASTVNLSVLVPPAMRARGASFVRGGRELTMRVALRGPDGRPFDRLLLRSLSGFELVPIANTDGVTLAEGSPDGQWVAVLKPASDQSSEQRLWKVSIDGSSPPVLIGDWDPQWTDIFWLEDGDLLTQTAGRSKFLRIPTNGGSPKPPVAFDMQQGAGYPSFESELPGGRGVLMRVEGWGPRGYQQDIWLLDTATGKARKFVENAANGRYIASTGHLLFSRSTVLLSVPLNLSTLALGEPTPIFDGLRSNTWNNGFFDVSVDGHLVFAAGGKLGLDRRLVAVDAAHEVATFLGDARSYESSLAISRDGRQVAVVIPNVRGTYEVWVGSIDRPGLRRTISFPNADAAGATWSPDAAWLAFARNGRDTDDGAYLQRADGSGEPRTMLKIGSPEEAIGVVEWAKDGSGVLIVKVLGAKIDLVLIPVSPEGQPGTPKSIVLPKGFQGSAALSPNGRLLAFSANDSGPTELYVVRLEAGAVVGQPLVVSAGGGAEPRWSADSRRLYFRQEHTRIMSVAIDTTPMLRASPATLMHDLNALQLDPQVWDILPDGRLLGIRLGTGEGDVTSYNVVINWLDSVRAKMIGVSGR